MRFLSVIPRNFLEVGIKNMSWVCEVWTYQSTFLQVFKIPSLFRTKENSLERKSNPFEIKPNLFV